MSINHYGPILFHYDLYPNHIEDFGKVKKLHTHQGIFCLKETEMSRDAAERFIHCIRRLDRRKYKNIIPIIPTKYGEYIIQTGEKIYYLMPWIEDEPLTERINKEELICGEMGVLHRLTAKTEDFSKELAEKAYLDLLKRWENRRQILERFQEESEAKTYMSPFELAFVTNYHYLNTMIESAKGHADKWLAKITEKNKYRTVVCHSKLSRNHVNFKKDGTPYIFNFEKATYDTPARDMALFFRHAFRYNLWDEEAMHYWLAAYNQHLQLLDEEKDLLLAYLFFPEPVVYAVRTYQESKGQHTELEHVKRLERRIMITRRVQRLKGLLEV